MTGRCARAGAVNLLPAGRNMGPQIGSPVSAGEQTAKGPGHASVLGHGRPVSATNRRLNIRDNTLKPTGTIGLTGALGSGKSTVARFLKNSLAAEYIDVDLICRHLLKPNARGWNALRQSLDREFFKADETVDRARLRHALFGDDTLRARVNRLLHPLAREEVEMRVQRIARLSGGPVVVEVPLLFEAGWEDIFDRIIVVYADCITCRARIMRRDGVSSAAASSGLAAQSSLLAKAMQADHVIDNSGGWAATCLQLLHLKKILQDTVRT
jgi:dephospho-CoA kinase